MFFSLVESERIKEAQDLAHQWNRESPTWIWIDGVPDTIPNPEKTSLSELVILSLCFSDQLEKAQHRLESMVQLAPNMASLRITLGDVYSPRGADSSEGS